MIANNRYTDEILRITEDYIFVVDVLRHILGNKYTLEIYDNFDNALPITNDTNNWANYKATFICFLLAMSDEDIDEFVASFA